MRSAFCFLIISIVTPNAKAQTISAISASICDSIHKIVRLDDESFYIAQRSIYHQELVKYPMLIVDITDLNKPRQFNEFNYKINRELLKTCDSYHDQFSFLPLSKILDLDGLFNKIQYDSLERAIIELIHTKKMDLVLVTVDDCFPYKNLKEFAESQRANWNIGARYQRGGILIAFNKALNIFEISLSKEAKEFISESTCLELLHDEAILPLSKGNYYNGFLFIVQEIKRQI